MHRKIVEQIQQVIDNSPWKDRVNVFVMSQTTGGFWQMAIQENGDGKTYLPHIRAIGLAIGSAYGEGLHTEHEGRWLVLS